MAVPKRHTNDQGSRDVVAAPWQSRYDLANDRTIAAFVDRHPHLVGLLERAPIAIRRHFGEHRGLRLEVVADPDAEGTEHLYLFIRADCPFEEAYARQRRLDEEWWLDAMADARGALTVGIERT